MEIIRRQDIDYFTAQEWAIIGKIVIHRICWENILKEYPQSEIIFEKLAKLGYPEYLKKFKGEIKEVV